VFAALEQATVRQQGKGVVRTSIGFVVPDRILDRGEIAPVLMGRKRGSPLGRLLKELAVMQDYVRSENTGAIWRNLFWKNA
jgi:hypothetical protein